MKIVLLGTGNVATHLGKALKMANQNVVQVWGRNPDSVTELADSIGAEPITELSKITHTADLYIIAVKDDAISQVAKGLTAANKIIIHTSGSTALDVLKDCSSKIGVLYPLQTFSKSKAVDFRQIPIAIEGNNPEVVQALRSLAERLSEKVIELNSAKRLTLHVAAVFACNFTNHLYALSQQILEQHKLNFGLLRPLIAETAANIQTHDPVNVQTGPAVRNDWKTLEKHLKFLKNNPYLADLYQKLSQSIVNLHKQS